MKKLTTKKVVCGRDVCCYRAARCSHCGGPWGMAHFIASPRCWHKEQREQLKKAAATHDEMKKRGVPDDRIDAYLSLCHGMRRCQDCGQRIFVADARWTRCPKCAREYYANRRRRPKTTLKCTVCGNSFTAPRVDTLYCSTSCRQKAHRQRRK